MLGEHLDAQTLLDWGLWDEVVPLADLMDRALALAEAYAAQPPIAVQMIKQTINQLGGALDAAILHMDADQNLLTSTTDDRKHAMQEFIDRTSPEFTGN
jgi:enoyl-CoA hydratase/carnithine racemase